MALCKLSKWTLTVVFSVLLTSFLQAQVDKATINGTITDQSGAVIPSVTVSVTSAETGGHYTGKSNEAGIYRISGLPVGTYSLESEKSGFKKLTRAGLSLATAQVAEVNLTM